MEDYLLHEIGKIGTLLRALLVRIGLAKKEPEEEIDGEQLRTDLLNRIDTDLDSLLAEPDFIAALTGRCGFDDGQLVRFADLLVDLVAASDDPDERLRRSRRGRLPPPRRQTVAPLARMLPHPQGARPPLPGATEHKEPR